MMVSRPFSRLGVRVGETSVFSWKTKAERRATISAGSKSARTFSRINSVRTNSSAEWIYTVARSALSYYLVLVE